MGNIRAKMIRVTGKLFDKRRRLVGDNVGNPNNLLYWLRRESRTNQFVIVRTFTSGWIARSARFRNQTDFEIATTDDLKTDALKTSHICIGSQVYSISEGDIVPPNDMRFTWLVIGKAVNQTFVAP